MLDTSFGKLYESPPGSGGNDGALPKVYDPTWQIFTNLTSEQIVAFQSFPQDLSNYNANRRWLAEMSGTTVAGVPLTTMDRDQSKVSQLKQAFDTNTISQVSFFDATGTVHVVDAATATAIYQGIVLFVQSTYDTAAANADAIAATPPTITTRKQIDAAFAAIAPNSPSAKNQS